MPKPRQVAVFIRKMPVVVPGFKQTRYYSLPCGGILTKLRARDICWMQLRELDPAMRLVWLTPRQPKLLRRSQSCLCLY